MDHLLKYTNSLLKLFVFLSMTSLIACNDQSNSDPYAYLNARVQGSTTPATKASADKTIINQQNKSDLPADVTRIEFIISDSEGETTTGSLSVGPQTDSISLRVLPHRDLNVTINVYSGDTLSYQGQSVVAALAPGQVFPLSIEADPVGGATLPTLSFSQAPASVIEGDANTTTNMTFTVTLSSLANGAVTVNYVTSDGTATASNSEIGDDYAISLGIITIPVTSLSATFDIAIYGDNSPESNETFNLTLSNASANVILGASTAIGTIIDDDYPERLNDTGVINCGYTSSTGTAAYTVDCAGTGVTTSTDGTISNPGNTLTLPAGQDALYGRDNLNNDDSDGLRGFSFTKLDANGNPLADQTQSYAAQPWSCVMDNHTGLIWEVKTTDKGLHDYWSTYTWYNSTGTDDSGDPGIANGGTCSDTGNCDTEKFISAVNGGATGSSNALCKTTNWRLPTTAELLSIVNNNGDSINSQVLPFIDTRFFPNAVSFIFTGGDQPTEYWTVNSSADPVTSSSAWSVFLLSGETKLMPKTSTTTVVRLVATGLTPRF